MTDCLACHDTGFVCEEHPTLPWEGTVDVLEGGCPCGAPGQPCEQCCAPLPEHEGLDIAWAFVPRRLWPDWLVNLAEDWTGRVSPADVAPPENKV